MLTNNKNYIESIYHDVKNPGSFGGIKPFARQSKLCYKDAEKLYLSTDNAYTLHKQIRRKFPRRKTVVYGRGHLWQADLIDLSSLSNNNDGNKFILTVIDCFSRKAFARQLRNKTAVEVRNAFISILEENQYVGPVYLQTDKGSEFLNSIFQDLLSRYQIKQYSSENEDIKAAIVERFNKTIKSRMFRYFTYTKSSRYVDKLQDFVYSYNNSYHKSIKMSPEKADTGNYDGLIFETLYPTASPKKKIKWKFNIGDKVRISKYRNNIFEKGYVSKWTTELFVIDSRYTTDPVTYGIKDLTGESIKGKFYSQELQLVLKDDVVAFDSDVYQIERIIKTRFNKRLRKKEYFVKWLNYPLSQASWTSDIIY